ncbi:MAG: dihydroorotase [Oscillospiraceae bacterium]|nr:dihydroorotase [Oscillospiraceae bacterium]
MTVLLKNGYIVDGKSREGVFDILIEDKLISIIAKDINFPADKTIDCTGLTVIPGICDMHVHLRDPGQTHKEDLISGGEAAAAGGVTAVLCMPNTSPVIDTPEIIRDIIERGKASKVKIYVCASITKGLQGKKLNDFKELRKAGAVAVSDDGRPVENARLMSEALVKARAAGLKVISHCENLDITGKGIINEGKISEKLEVEGVSRSSENIMVLRDMCLAHDLRASIHITHVSTKEAAVYIKAFTERGIMATCDTTPHYFTLTEDSLMKQDADYRMSPPLREFEDVMEITKALCNDVFDCIASDHAPHTPDEKSDFHSAPNGVIGLETLLPVTLTRLYHTGKLPLMKIVRLLCINPRRILGIGTGGLEAGGMADIAVFDLNKQWVVNPEKLHSKSKNTCFKGMRVKGRIKYTLVNGEIVYEDK